MLNFLKSKTGRILRSGLNVLIFAALCVLVLILLSEDFAAEVSRVTTGGGISADALEKRLGEEVKILIVFPSVDEYAANCALKLSERLSSNPSLKVSFSYDDAADLQESDLTVYLGHTNMNSESYIQAMERLGPDGLEITHEENADGNTDRLFILAFNEKKLDEGIDRFADYFLSVSRLYKTFAALYVTEKSQMTFSLPEKRTVTGNSFSLLTLSYPGTDSYSLPAIKTLAEKFPSDMLVFDCGLDFASDREGLRLGWEKIISSVSRYNKETSVFLPADGYTSKEQLLSCDVLASVKADAAVRGTESSFIMLESESGKPLGFIAFLCDGSDAAKDIEYLSDVKALAQREVRHELPLLVYMPAITKEIQQILTAASKKDDASVFLNENTDSRISAYAEAVRPGLSELGAAACIFALGYTNAGVCTDNSGCLLGITGSIDFNSPGLGGRFAYDNSLRGVLFTSFNFNNDASEIIGMRYVFASEYGLTEKNVG